MVPVILPLISALLPIIVITRSSKNPVKRPFVYSVGSFTCAFAALCLEVYTIMQRVNAGDFGGIEDTIGAVLFICIILSVIPVVLNFIALGLSYTKNELEQ